MELLITELRQATLICEDNKFLELQVGMPLLDCEENHHEFLLIS